MFCCCRASSGLHHSLNLMHLPFDFDYALFATEETVPALFFAINILRPWKERTILNSLYTLHLMGKVI